MILLLRAWKCSIQNISGDRQAIYEFISCGFIFVLLDFQLYRCDVSLKHAALCFPLCYLKGRFICQSWPYTRCCQVCSDRKVEISSQRVSNNMTPPVMCSKMFVCLHACMCSQCAPHFMQMLLLYRDKEAHDVGQSGASCSQTDRHTEKNECIFPAK